MKKTSIISISVIAMFLGFISSSTFAQDAEYNLIRRTYKVNNDGSLDINYRKEIKLIRNRAITAYADKGETFILYNPSIDELTINESYTIRPDGSRVQTPANAFIDQLPSECQDCGRYNGIRERAVIHTGLEYNCIVVLDYTIHRKKFNVWNEELQLTQDCPVKKYEVIVDVPNDNGEYSITKIGNGKKIKEISDNHSFHFKANNLEQTYVGDYLPNPHIMYPYIKILLKSKDYKDINYSNETVPEASNVIADLHDNNIMVWATNIRDWVADNIHEINIPADIINQQEASASKVFNSNCGNINERTRLVIAMLNQAGIKAWMNKNIYFTVNENGNNINYTMLLDKKSIPHIDGAAIDELRTIERSETIPWSGKILGNGYAQMELPAEKGSINIDPARLTSDRKAPIKVRNCNEKYHYTILLPRTPKRVMVGKPINIEYTKKGLGFIKISISQNPGGGIEVIRELNIDAPNGIISTKQYKAFRKMMQDWNNYNTITVKSELSQHFGL